MDRIAAASGAYTCFRSDLVELRPCCTLLGRLARQLLLLLDLSASVMVFRPLSTSKWNWPNRKAQEERIVLKDFVSGLSFECLVCGKPCLIGLN